MKALFIGLGGVGQRHLRIMRDLVPDIRLGAVRHQRRTFEIGDDMQPDYATDIAEKYGIETFTTIEEGLAFQPDFAVVANPTSLHVATCISLASQGIPVLVEKPVSSGFDRLAQLNDMVQKGNATVMVGYMMRFNPCAVKLFDLIGEGKIGKMFSVTLVINSYMPGWHRYEKYNSFYAGQKSLGGGVVLTEIHEIDLLAWYFGSPQRLWAVGGKKSRLDLDVEDTVSVLMEQNYQNEVFPVTVSMSFVQPELYRKMILLGEYGRIEWDIVENEINVNEHKHHSNEVYRFPNFERNDMFIAQMNHFLDCIRTGKKPLTSLDRVMDGHLTALTIKKALETGAVTEILTL